ncbi:MAG: hypothetical protein RL358_271 [Pseudomonadota bacterium]|jgi:MSHA biogenesis protein MshO
MKPSRKPNLGFTLIELIMVIVITGILGSMVAVFLKAPIQQYLDVSRRGELTDIGDTALYRLASDISTAVPNSVRVAGCTAATPCVEFLPTKGDGNGGGRYRAAQDVSSVPATGDILDFTIADSSFDIIGAPMIFAAAPADYIVLGSTQSSGAPAYDVSAAGVLRQYTGVAGAQPKVTLTATQFPAFAQLASQRFDVIDGVQQAVTFSCEGTLTTLDANGDGQAKLWKHWAYGFNAAQAAPATLVGKKAVLADKVSACAIDYNPNNQRMGLLGVRLTLMSKNESVSLYHEVHVNNTP